MSVSSPRRSTKPTGRVLVGVVVAAVTLGLVACAGQTDPATNVTNVSAQLNAHGYSNDGPATWWWEYDTVKADLGTANDTEVCGGIPPEADHRCGPASGGSQANQVAVSTVVTRLTPNTTYFFRACGQDTNDASPSCAGTLSFKTLGRHQLRVRPQVGHARHGQRPVRRSRWRRHRLGRQRLRRRLRQQPDPEVQLHGRVHHQVGHLRRGNGQFIGAQDVATDSAGNVYVADTGNSRIQKFSSTGDVHHQVGQLRRRATASSTSPLASPPTPPATSTSPTPPTTGSRSSARRAPSSPSGAPAARATASSSTPTASPPTRRQRLRRRLGQQPDPEVQLDGHLHHQVGQPAARATASSPPFGRRHRLGRQRLRRRLAATTGSRSSAPPAPSSPSGAPRARATASSTDPDGVATDSPATSTSPTTTTTASRSSSPRNELLGFQSVRSGIQSVSVETGTHEASPRRRPRRRTHRHAGRRPGGARAGRRSRTGHCCAEGRRGRQEDRGAAQQAVRAHGRVHLPLRPQGLCGAAVPKPVLGAGARPLRALCRRRGFGGAPGTAAQRAPHGGAGAAPAGAWLLARPRRRRSQQHGVGRRQGQGGLNVAVLDTGIQPTIPT